MFINLGGMFSNLGNRAFANPGKPRKGGAPPFCVTIGLPALTLLVMKGLVLGRDILMTMPFPF